MFPNDFLAILQLILLTIIFVSTLIIALMVYDMHRIASNSRIKDKKRLAELLPSRLVKCSRCGTPMRLIYDGVVVDGYACPKCGHTEITSKKEEMSKAAG